MKIETEITLGSAAIKLAANADGETLAKLASKGLASEAYRTAASKAFKGVEDRSKLSFEECKAKLEPVFKALGWTASFSLYIAPEAKAAMVRATGVYDAALAAKKLEQLCKKVGCKPTEPKEKIIAAVHEFLRPKLEELLA